MVSDGLAGFGGQHLQEGDLVAVRLVRQLEAAGLHRDVREPSQTVLGDVHHFLRHGGLGGDAGGQLLHVAVDQDGVVGVAGVGVDPVLTWSQEGMTILQDDGMILLG